MLAALTAFVLGLASSPLTVVERTEYYDVAGSTEHELRADIDRRRPKDSESVRRDAVAKWDIQWKYRYATASDGCAVASLTTTVEVVTIFPRWSNRQSGAVAQRWDKWIAALEVHETEHTQIALAAAQVIHERLSAVEAARTCPLLEESINSKGLALLDQLRNDNAEYDRRTQHGATQGTRFP
jgi:predicted secreted Zn-dependent protease